MNNDLGLQEGGFLQRLRALDAEAMTHFVSQMNAQELLAFVIFLIFTIAFFLWVAYLAIRR